MVDRKYDKPDTHCGDQWYHLMYSSCTSAPSIIFSFDRLLEDHSHFSTLPKAPLDSSGHLAFVYGYFFPDKGLQVSLLVEKVLYNDGIVAIHWSFLVLFFEEPYVIVLFLLIVEDSDTAVKGDSACFLVIIDVWLIADDLEPNVSEKIFLKGDNRE